MAYVGLMVGAAKGDYLELSALGGIFSDKVARRDLKILDTSVIIDGRIADVAENWISYRNINRSPIHSARAAASSRFA